MNQGCDTNAEVLSRTLTEQQNTASVGSQVVTIVVFNLLMVGLLSCGTVAASMIDAISPSRYLIASLTLVALSFVFAWLASAYGRARFERIAIPGLAMLTVMYLLVFATSAGPIAKAVSDLSSSGANPTIWGAFAFWLLMVGYGFKSLFDGVRDRLGDYLEDHLPHWL